MELGNETGRSVSVAMTVDSLTASSARLLLGMAEWSGIH